MTRQFILFILINDWGGGVQGRRKGLGSNSVLKFNDFLLRVFVSFVSLQGPCLKHCGGCMQRQSETTLAAASPFPPAIANRGESLRCFVFGIVLFSEGPMLASVALSVFGESCSGARKQSFRGKGGSFLPRPARSRIRCGLARKGNRRGAPRNFSFRCSDHSQLLVSAKFRICPCSPHFCWVCVSGFALRLGARGFWGFCRAPGLGLGSAPRCAGAAGLLAAGDQRSPPSGARARPV